MPINNSSGGGGGPWGGGPRNGGGGGGRNPWGSGPQGGGGRGPGGGGNGGGQGPDLDDLLRKGREQLRVVLGGKSGGGFGGRGSGSGGIPPGIEKAVPFVIGGLLVVTWAFLSFYRVDTREQSVELFLGAYSETGTEGLNFAPWPIVTHEIVETESARTIEIGTGTGRNDSDRGLMLTGDENIVDIDFSVVWNVANPADFLFNLQSPDDTITAVSESAMREVIARSQLKPILSRDRAEIASQVQQLIQNTLNEYNAGVNIITVNFADADPPPEVIDAFRDVQAAEQDRDTEEKRADAYANQTLAAARGEVAEMLQKAEAYRARVVNEAKGEAARFISVYEEYANAPEVTRKRLYLETMERVLGDVDKIIIDEQTGGNGGQGVVPYLPLNELNRGRTQARAETSGNRSFQSGGTN
ncbi:MAG: FtsH protease activity modulator HflK [Pseudomonadota bacterium]